MVIFYFIKYTTYLIYNTFLEIRGRFSQYSAKRADVAPSVFFFFFFSKKKDKKDHRLELCYNKNAFPRFYLSCIFAFYIKMLRVIKNKILGTKNVFQSLQVPPLRPPLPLFTPPRPSPPAPPLPNMESGSTTKSVYTKSVLHFKRASPLLSFCASVVSDKVASYEPAMELGEAVAFPRWLPWHAYSRSRGFAACMLLT